MLADFEIETRNMLHVERLRDRNKDSLVHVTCCLDDIF